jgi:hypothetical protein
VFEPEVVCDWNLLVSVSDGCSLASTEPSSLSRPLPTESERFSCDLPASDGKFILDTEDRLEFGVEELPVLTRDFCKDSKNARDVIIDGASSLFVLLASTEPSDAAF